MPRGTKKRNFKKNKTRNNKKLRNTRRLKKGNKSKKRKQRRTRRKSKKGGAPCDGEQGISITHGCKPGRYSIIDIKDDGIYLVLGMTNNPIRGIKRKHEVLKWDSDSEKFNFPYLYKKLIRFKKGRVMNWEYKYTMDNSSNKSLILWLDSPSLSDNQLAKIFSNAYKNSSDSNEFYQFIQNEKDKKNKEKADMEAKRKAAKKLFLENYRQGVRKEYEAALKKERAAVAMEEEKVKKMTPKERNLYEIQQKREKWNKEYEEQLSSTAHENIISNDEKVFVWDPEN